MVPFSRLLNPLPPLLSSPLLSSPQMPEGAFHQIMRAAHVIKGASSNLMCQQLRATAMALEQAASVANGSAGDAAAVAANAPIVQARHGDLRKAVQNYHAFLQSIGI